MRFSSILSYTVLGLAGSAFANLHPNCACHNGDSYNWRVTTLACQVYTDAGYEWGGGFYDSPSGRCVANDGSSLAGNEWEAACRTVATSGFDCADGIGKCFAFPESVRGRC
ncbi:hypothetical protein B0O99DRAFT_681001 [Bisporella sp. PMI_857]|nr:hypothetical protein B0O99DRAFT_681001 [Bisporella sp. PMI_857]